MLADYLRRSMESTKCILTAAGCYYAALQKWEYLHMPILKASSSHWFKSWREESFRVNQFLKVQPNLYAPHQWDLFLLSFIV
ncbi:unnamed protein product [Urochloa humidicola]